MTINVIDIKWVPSKFSPGSYEQAHNRMQKRIIDLTEGEDYVIINPEEIKLPRGAISTTRIVEICILIFFFFLVVKILRLI